MQVVIVGATGLIGTAVANLLFDEGHEIIGVSRHTQPGLDIEDLAAINAFYDAVGQVDAVICAVGYAGMGALAELSDEAFQVGVTRTLIGQLNLVRKGLAHVRPDGAFILTGGMLAYNAWPATSIISMANAGLEGFVRGAALDLQNDRRILVVHPPAMREWAVQMGMDGAPWPNAATVAETYLMALESQITGQPVFVAGYEPP